MEKPKHTSYNCVILTMMCHRAMDPPEVSKHSDPTSKQKTICEGREMRMMDGEAESVCRSSYENSYDVIRTGAQQKFVSNLILKTLFAMW